MAALIAGLVILALSLDMETGPATWLGRLGAASAVVALALEGALQAVDGVAYKQADLAWVSAADAEKAGALRQRRGHPLDRVGDAELPGLCPWPRVPAVCGRAGAGSLGRPADRLP